MFKKNANNAVFIQDTVGMSQEYDFLPFRKMPCIFSSGGKLFK